MACFITVMDDNERDSMATLDFPATSPDWAATSTAFHLNRALMLLVQPHYSACYPSHLFPTSPVEKHKTLSLAKLKLPLNYTKVNFPRQAFPT